MTTQPNADDRTDIETMLADDHFDLTDITERNPRTPTEVRALIGAAAEFHNSVGGLEHDQTYVQETDDGVTGKIAVTRTTDRDFTAVKQLINFAGGEVTGVANTHAGRQGVHFTFDFDDVDDDDDDDDDDAGELVTDGGRDVRDRREHRRASANWKRRAITDNKPTDIEPTMTECDGCGKDFPRESLREDGDDLLCGKCFHEADDDDPRDFAVEDIRHVNDAPCGDIDVPDDFEETTHLVTVDDPDESLCGQPVAGLRAAGHPADTPLKAARLGSWVNDRDDMCDECREAFNDVVFDQ